MIQRGTKEFYEAMDAFERSLRTMPVYGKSVQREERNSRYFYQNGDINAMFIAFLHGYAYALSATQQ